jgi:hypothetical protein
MNRLPAGKLVRWMYLKIKEVIGEKNVWKLFFFFTNTSNLMKLGVFRFRNILRHGECYITCSGKQDGAGAQALAIMSTMLFAEANKITYVHTPFSKIQHNYENDIEWEKKWEEFFNLGLDEVKLSDLGPRITREIFLNEEPFRIKKQTNTLHIIRHCHEYADLDPNGYNSLKSRLVGKYYGSPKQGYELFYDPKKLNIAVHIRRGDVDGNNQFRDKFTENSYILRVLSDILEITTLHGLDPAICVYSEGFEEDFKELEKLRPKFHLDTSPFTTFHNLVEADILLMSKSTFSYCAALLSDGIVFYEFFRHRPQSSWIKVKEGPRFDTKTFSNKLSRYLTERL